MGTLYIDRKGIQVKLDGNALAFYVNGEREGVAPIPPLKRVVAIGNIVFETPVLNKLADAHVTVIFLSGRRLRFHGMLHGRFHRNGALRLKQYEKSLSGFLYEFSLDVVQRKVQSQLNVLNDVLPQRPDLRFPLATACDTLKKIVNSLLEINLKLNTPDFELPERALDSLRGHEGSAAAAYFSAYKTLFADSLHFQNRNRRPPKDPVNAMLSLCYTMIHYEIVREIETIGFDPTIGFYHQFEYGRESLACDLVEIYRSEVDRFVWSLFREREFTSRDFAFETDRPGCYLKKKGGRQRFYPLYEAWAKRIRPQVTEEVRNLAHKITDGCIDVSAILPENEYGE